MPLLIIIPLLVFFIVFSGIWSLYGITQTKMGINHCETRKEKIQYYLLSGSGILFFPCLLILAVFYLVYENIFEKE